MKVLILSAGQGKRLLPHTQDTPKCALDVGGASVLEVQLQQINACGVEEAVVLTGFRADKVDAIAASVSAPRTRTLYNPFFDVSDNLATCWVATREMDGPFVIVNGDTLFEAPILARLLATEPTHPVTLVVDRKEEPYDADDMKVITEDGLLKRVGKQLALSEGVNGESIGMMVFRGEGPKLFQDTVEAMMREESGQRRWYLSAIDRLAEQGHVAVCDIQGLGWCEVDDQSDLENARRVVPTWCSNSAGER